MATDLAEKAKEAFVDDDFQLAVDLYTQAINLNPKSADLFADRAQANIKLNSFTEAVADANKAIEFDPSMVKAYLRKGTACFKLEEYHTAKAALETGASLAQNDSRFTKLIKECDERITEETGDLTRPLMPNVPPMAAHASVGYPSSDRTVGKREEAEQGHNESHQMKEMASVQPKYRHTYYQKPEEVVVTIFAKGIPAKNVAVDFGEQILSVTIDVPGENVYHFQSRLFGKIVPDKCRYEVLSTKVEIHLAKAEAINWTSLEYSKEVTVPQKINVSSDVGSQRPTYPSSKLRATDWDKLEAQVKNEEKEEKLDGDAALNKLFGDIYKNADEDMRRAMIKSFVESNGTVLSTNWNEVGSKKVEGSPPDGMELKKWEY
uniref:SGT1 n=1 Tax=Davidia involucrata TaxID=16924 RepID=A0A5B7B960_DAVIN